MRIQASLLSAVLLATIYACSKDDENVIYADEEVLPTLVSIGEGVAFPDQYTLADLESLQAVMVKAGAITYAIGYRQVSALNQDAVLAKFVGNDLIWERSDFETTGDDSRGYALLWDGGQKMYAVFSVTGTQGEASEDFRRFAQNGWHSSYGQGGGAKVAVVASINPDDGEPISATFVMSRLQNGNANSLVVNNMELLNNGHLKLYSDAWFSPYKASRMLFNCQGTSPFAYTLVLDADLMMAVSAEAAGCQ